VKQLESKVKELRQQLYELDNVRHELQELQVENRRLRAGLSEGSDNSAEVKQLESEVEELRQQLYEARESEVKASEQLSQAREQTNELRAKVDKLKLLLEDAKSVNEKLETELAQARARHESMVQEALLAQEKADLERFRAVDAERAKWEVRETCLVAQLDECTSRSGTNDRAAAGSKEPHSTCYGCQVV